VPSLGAFSRQFDQPRTSSYVYAVIGTIGISYCLAALWIGMRLVMDVGGNCASGNSAYVIQAQCPDGSALLVAPAVPLGFVFGAIMAFGFAGIAKGAGSLVLLSWPILFLSLAFNFFQGAFNPPGDSTFDVAWLICGIVFALMGLLPAPGVPKLFAEVEPRRGQVVAILVGGAAAGVLLAIWLANAVS